MNIKPNYIIIPALVFLSAFIGGLITRSDQAWNWYKNSVVLPDITPPSWVFPIAWNSIFILTALSIILVWNTFERTNRFWLIIGLFLVNAFLNIFWSYLFFGQHLIGYALLDAILLELNILALIVLIAQQSVYATALLIPYAAWCLFAIYLNYLIWIMN